MKIGIVGATGKQGTLLLLEAYKRGHEVTALIRNQAKLAYEVPYIEKELYDLTENEVANFDVIIDAFNAPTIMPQLHQTSLRHLTKILKHSDARLFVVGGAGSLATDSSRTIQLYETPDFPSDFYPVAKSMALALDELKKSQHTTWTYISPAADFSVEGDLTKNYQLSNDVLTLNSQGKSYISYADYALGFMDVIEKGGYENTHLSLVSN
ncbi:NAD(P)-dependent oxidoreductase [Vagococcus intermedius]|uniref:NAD(P)H-binding protein n=1 Tax=Vagococcus intermedius TaxID=2991418 RepID=A0AAF0CTL9_9ENTE|nr:NAD(P)H-binding protein [Vagococcus intermedius]WEG72666.1 NAD(P)H-binding protein [Vagococcus intermedius]WEG74751.1 NAD(P)H-binding protein [Vagococcus intermedius]